MLNKDEALALCRAEHGDPFAVLGPHKDAEGRLWLRTLQPGADAVYAIDAESGQVLVELKQRKIEPFGAFSGLFEAQIPARPAAGDAEPPRYRLRIVWPGGVQEADDPYRFPPVLGEMDVWLLAEGSHLRPFERLGAHPCQIDGVDGVAFAVWAPDAQRVSVIGDFNTWDSRRHPMRQRPECGVWEIFLPGIDVGA